MTEDLKARAQRAIEESERAERLCGVGARESTLRGLLTEALETLSGHEQANRLYDQTVMPQVRALETERDDLRRKVAAVPLSLLSAHKEVESLRDTLNEASEWCQAVEADNAALVELVKVRQDALCRVRALNWNLGGPANRDADGNWVVCPEWERRMLGIIADAIGPLNGDAPIYDHPGAPLLEVVNALDAWLSIRETAPVAEFDAAFARVLAADAATRNRKEPTNG